MKKFIKILTFTSLLSIPLSAWTEQNIRTAFNNIESQSLDSGLTQITNALINEINTIENSTSFGKSDIYESIFAPIREFINKKCTDITKSEKTEKYTQTTTFVNKQIDKIEASLNSKKNINKSLNSSILIQFYVLKYWLSEDGWYLGQETHRILNGLKENMERLNIEITEKQTELSTLQGATDKQLEEMNEKLLTLTQEANKVSELTKDINTIKQERDKLQLNNTTLKKQIETLENTTKTNETKIQELETQAKNLDAAHQELLLLNTKNEEQLTTLTELLKNANDRNADLGKELNETKEQVKQLDIDKNDALKQLDGLINETKTLKENLEKTITNKEELNNKLGIALNNLLVLKEEKETVLKELDNSYTELDKQNNSNKRIMALQNKSSLRKWIINVGPSLAGIAYNIYMASNPCTAAYCTANTILTPVIKGLAEGVATSFVGNIANSAYESLRNKVLSKKEKNI